jgi:hypothetical protein
VEVKNLLMDFEAMIYVENDNISADKLAISGKEKKGADIIIEDSNI